MTIQEIAKLAKVSISTVSKIMNGKDKDISEATRNKVLKVVEENNYIPYEKYREKEGLSSKLVGLLLKKRNMYAGQILSAVEEILREQGYQLVVRIIDPKETLDDVVQELWRRGIAGVLIDSAEAIFCKPDKMQVVYFTDTAMFDAKQENTFYYRKSEAGRLAAELLLELEHENISCILLQEDQSILKGVQTVYRERHLPEQYLVSYLGNDEDDIKQNALSMCVTDSVSAVICGNVKITREVIAYAKNTGMKIPEELSVICMGDSEALEYMEGGITAISYPAVKSVQNAVRHLLQMIVEKRSCEVARKFSYQVSERKSLVRRYSEKDSNKIVVVGSINRDHIINGVNIPTSGETKIAGNILTMAGGKGRNQAAGVGRLGGKAYMVGRIGKDYDGRVLYKSLKEYGVHLDGTEFDEKKKSGKAFIHVDREGENAIVVFRGANENLDEKQLKRHERLFENAKFCLLSSEILKKTLLAVIRNCQKNETKIILKPSALDEVDCEMFKGIDYLVPNEREMEQINIVNGTLEERSEALLELGVKNVIVTLGKNGAYLKNKEYSMYFPAAPFEAIDTTGGADSFISALAVSLSEGKDLIYSIVYATYAAGITVTRYGVQEALPNKKTMDSYQDAIEQQYKIQINER